MIAGPHRRQHGAIALLLGALFPGVPASAGEPGSVSPVGGFEVERYLGRWHEIAAIPAWFQEDCVAETTATYSAAGDVDGITVLNACVEADGTLATAEGRARFTGPPDEGALEVTFLSLFGFWLWPLAGAYVVIDLDADYRWSAVAHPSRDYGWILARDETLPPETLARIAESFRAAGYDTCRLLMSPRAEGDPRTPLCDLL